MVTIGRTRSLASRGALIAGSAAAATFAIVRAPARAAEFDYKCTTTIPSEHPAVVRTKQMWAAIERETGGRLRVQDFADGQLGGDAATLSQLRLGAIQFYIGMANLPSVVPAIGITQVGFTFKDEREALHAMDGPFGEYLNREMEAKGLYILRPIWGNGMRDMTCTPRAVRTPEDMSGIKIRVADSRVIVDFFKLLGATPVSLNFSEVYTALQTRVIDAEEATLSAIEAARFYEVQKYLSLTHHLWTGAALVSNLQIWNALPADIRQTVLRNCAKYGALQRRDVAAYATAVADKFARRGLPVNAVDPAAFRNRLGPYYATWSKEFGPTAWALLQNSVSGKIS